MRKKFFLAVCLLSFGLAVRAQTVTPIYYFSNCVSAPLDVVQVTVTPLFPDTNYTGRFISSYLAPYTRLNTPSLTNGGPLIISNLANCYVYQVDFYDGFVDTLITNYFPITATGRVNAVNWPYLSTNATPFQTAAYSMQESDLLFIKSLVADNANVTITIHGNGVVGIATTGGGGSGSLWAYYGDTLYPNPANGSDSLWSVFNGTIYPNGIVGTNAYWAFDGTNMMALPHP